MTFGKTAVLSRLARVALILVTTGALAACGLPRSGPVKNELFDASVSEAGNAFIVPVTDVVAQQTFSRPATGFSSSFLDRKSVV